MAGRVDPGTLLVDVQSNRSPIPPFLITGETRYLQGPPCRSPTPAKKLIPA